MGNISYPNVTIIEIVFYILNRNNEIPIYHSRNFWNKNTKYMLPIFVHFRQNINISMLGHVACLVAQYLFNMYEVLLETHSLQTI